MHLLRAAFHITCRIAWSGKISRSFIGAASASVFSWYVEILLLCILRVVPEDTVIPFSLNKKNLLLLDRFGIQGDVIVVTLQEAASTGIEAINMYT